MSVLNKKLEQLKTEARGITVNIDLKPGTIVTLRTSVAGVDGYLEEGLTKHLIVSKTSTNSYIQLDINSKSLGILHPHHFVDGMVDIEEPNGESILKFIGGTHESKERTKR